MEKRLFCDCCVLHGGPRPEWRMLCANPLRDHRIVLGIPSDINQYPSLVSCDVLLLGTGCGPDEALKQFPVPESVHVLVLVTIPFAL